MAIETAGCPPVVDLTQKIHTIRGIRVILDADLAEIYGVKTFRLNEQVKRNRKRFPKDFAFVLTQEEFTNLISQNAISSLKRHGGRRKAATVFTEHGALMVAHVLRSERADEMSVFVVRAFIRMREVLTANAALREKLTELEHRITDHDSSIAEILSAIRQLVNPEESQSPKREIGFHVKNLRNLKK